MLKICSFSWLFFPPLLTCKAVHSTPYTPYIMDIVRSLGGFNIWLQPYGYIFYDIEHL